MRDRLIEIVNKAKEEYANDITDHTETEYIVESLLNNGVVAPPVKENQTVYVIDRADVQRPIKEKIVLEIQYGYSGNLFVLQDTPFRLRRAYSFGEIGKTVFLSREEAEAKLKEGKG